MGKASRKKKLIQEKRADKTGILKSSQDSKAKRKEEVLTTAKTKQFYLIAIIIAVSFAVYFNALSNGFVYDDASQVLGNRWITDVRYIPEIFSEHVWGFEKGTISNYYRPLMHVIYMFNYYIFGLKPLGFHLVNILFHGGVSVLVFIIILRLFIESQYSSFSFSLIPSFIATLLFVTHPIHTEAVTWVAGITDLSFTFLYLLSFYLYIRSTGNNLASKGTYLLSVFLFFLATLCKEPALTLPIILVAYDYTFRKERVYSIPFLKKYIPYLMVAGIYFMLRFHALGGFVGGFSLGKRHTELSIYQDLINIFPLFMQYLEKLILPVNLNAFHVLHPVSSIFEAKWILSFLITMAFVVLALVALKKNKVVFIGLLFILVPLLPVLYIPVLGVNTFAERYLYLPSIGFAILFASFAGWERVNPRLTIILTIVSMGIVGLYCIGTLSRNSIWKDDYVLFMDTVKKSPDGVFPRNDFGASLMKRGEIDAAIEQFKIATKLDPNYADAHNNLGAGFFLKGWTDKAVEQYQLALTLKPDYADAHFNLGLCFFRKGLVDKAIEQFQVATKLNPNYVDAHFSLGSAFLSKGLIDKAIEELQTAVRLNPSNIDFRNNLVKAYEQKRLSHKN